MSSSKTKMSYVLKSSGRERSRVPTPIKIILGVVVLVAFLNFFAPQALPTFFTTLVRPFWDVEHGLLHGKTPREELQTLLVQSGQNQQQNFSVLSENAELKDLLGRAGAAHPLLATILKRPPYTPYDIFLLDVGTKDGVSVGDRVFALGNIPVGSVAEVMEDTSKVRLFTSSGEKFDILIGPTHIQTVATGKGGGFFEATLPRDTKIKTGDVALIPALSDAFVGTVQGIASDPAEPFSKILFRQPVNMYEMRWVIVDVGN